MTERRKRQNENCRFCMTELESEHCLLPIRAIITHDQADNEIDNIMRMTKLHMTYGPVLLNQLKGIQIGIEKRQDMRSMSQMSDIITNITADQIQQTHRWMFGEQQRIETERGETEMSQEYMSATRSLEGARALSEIREEQKDEEVTEADGQLRNTGYTDEDDEKTSWAGEMNAITDRARTRVAEERAQIDAELKTEQEKLRADKQKRKHTHEMTEEDGKIEKESEAKEDWKTVGHMRRTESKGENVIEGRKTYAHTAELKTGPRTIDISRRISKIRDRSREKQILDSESDSEHEALSRRNSGKTDDNQKIVKMGDYPLRHFIKCAERNKQSGTMMKHLIPFLQTEASLEKEHGSLYEPYLKSEPETFKELAKTLFALRKKGEANPERIRPINIDELKKTLELLSDIDVSKRRQEVRIVSMLTGLISGYKPKEQPIAEQTRSVEEFKQQKRKAGLVGWQ